MRGIIFGVLATFSLCVSAESLEDRVKALEAQVTELRALIAELSVIALRSQSVNESETDTSSEDNLATLIFLAAMKQAIDEEQTQSEIDFDCIQELDANMTALEKNSSFTTVGWMLKYQSTCSESVVAKVNIEWYTSDDFLLEHDTAYARFAPNTNGQVNGEKRLFSTEKFEKIDKYKISIVR